MQGLHWCGSYIQGILTSRIFTLKVLTVNSVMTRGVTTRSHSMKGDSGRVIVWANCTFRSLMSIGIAFRVVLLWGLRLFGHWDISYHCFQPRPTSSSDMVHIKAVINRYSFWIYEDIVTTLLNLLKMKLIEYLSRLKTPWNYDRLPSPFSSTYCPGVPNVYTILEI